MSLSSANRMFAGSFLWKAVDGVWGCGGCDDDDGGGSGGTNNVPNPRAKELMSRPLTIKIGAVGSACRSNGVDG